VDEAPLGHRLSAPVPLARIGYATAGRDLSAPGDRRRFCHYAARRGLAYERADPARPYDVVIANYTADLGVWSRMPRGSRLVLDLVDSHFAVTRGDARAAARGLVKFAFRRTRHLHLDYRRLLEETCRRADAVVCATEEQRSRVLPLCPNVHAVLDFQPEASSVVKTGYGRGEVFRLVWEGLPWNVATLRDLLGALREVRRRHRVGLRIVTDSHRPLLFGDSLRVPTRWSAPDVFGVEGVERVDWSRETLAARLVECDLAVIPIPLDHPFMAGKPENKLVLFWRMGLPVVTSATPAYQRAMRGAGLELTCRTTADWVRALERMVDDEGARREAGRRGRAFAETHHSEAALLGRWDAVFASLGLDPARSAGA